MRSPRLRAARPGWTVRPTDAQLGYGGALFDRASGFVRARSAGRPADGVDGPTAGPTGRSRSWLVDAGGALALIRLATNLPVLEVRLTDSAAGVAIGRALAGRTLGVPRNRLCAAVLTVPESVADRPSGKRHQALRTGLTAAARAGVRVRPVPDPQERRRFAADAVREVQRLERWSQSAPEHTEHDWWVAEDGAGRLVGIATVVVDAEWASLITLVGIPGSGMESHARYVLHHAVVQSLSRAGVAHLAVLDHSPLLLDPGPQHLQRVLGFRPVRLRRPRPLVPGRVVARDQPPTAEPSGRPVAPVVVDLDRPATASRAQV